MISLTDQEQKELVRLMDKISFPTPLLVFEAWCRVFGVVCAEVIVIKNKNKNPEIFLTYRDDKYFKGWHIPGCIHLPTEKIENTLKRVLKTEIVFRTSDPTFLRWFERSSGDNNGESKRGYELSILFEAETKERIEDKDNKRFFRLDQLPDDILSTHIPIINNFIQNNEK